AAAVTAEAHRWAGRGYDDELPPVPGIPEADGPVPAPADEELAPGVEIQGHDRTLVTADHARGPGGIGRVDYVDLTVRAPGHQGPAVRMPVEAPHPGRKGDAHDVPRRVQVHDPDGFGRHQSGDGQAPARGIETDGDRLSNPRQRIRLPARIQVVESGRAVA